MKWMLTIIGAAMVCLFVYALCKAAGDADRKYGLTREDYAETNAERDA